MQIDKVLTPLLKAANHVQTVVMKWISIVYHGGTERFVSNSYVGWEDRKRTASVIVFPNRCSDVMEIHQTYANRIYGQIGNRYEMDCINVLVGAIQSPA